MNQELTGIIHRVDDRSGNVRHFIPLDGDWDFAYSKDAPNNIQSTVLPQDDAYEVSMPVPGYWDDHTERLKYAKFWSRDCNFNPEYRQIAFPLGAGKPADASLPYLIGAGWYKKTFRAEADWNNKSVVLHVGGVSLEAWVWLNGKFIGYHLGHLTPFEFELNEALQPGKQNELVIAVANTRKDRRGCSIRGFKGRSAGITRSVYLQVTGTSRISDCYVRTNPALDQLIWEIHIEQKSFVQPIEIDWKIEDPQTGQLIARGSEPAQIPATKWTTGTFGMETWSDKKPRLYRLHFTLRAGDRIIDEYDQRFGLRYLDTKGRKLLLNGEPVLFRGLTDHAYFPETCTVPTSISFYMDTIKKLKKLGFNWIRFHTWAPPEECMIAADELGMMLQVETPNGFKEQEWLDLLKMCRKHPSVVIYCCGNEVGLDDAMIDRLALMAQHCHNLVPDCLFNPMEGLRKVEYDVDVNAPGFVQEPYPHNADKLKRLKAFSDVFAPHGSIFSYHSLATDDRLMEQRLSMYERPCLMHEIGIYDSYLNLDLEHRYVGTRIGPDLYSAARAYLKEMGLLNKAPLYYQNSCKWMQQMIKYTIEQARRSEYVSGYNLLGAIDCHWHRTGYAVGLLNEFYELKPGQSIDDVQSYNGESVLLAKCGKNRNLKAGQKLSVHMFVSLYGNQPITQGTLSWQLVDDEQYVYTRGEKEVFDVETGQVTDLSTIAVDIPNLLTAKHLKLKARLSGGTYEIMNSWDYWVFPDVQISTSMTERIKVIEQLDIEAIDYMANGGRVLLLGSGQFPSLDTTFQIMSGGRTQGNNATVIYDHPLVRDFPHDGFCDWQFYSMIEGARTVVFNELDLPFHPIVEIVSSYKMIRKQASLFEYGVGKGGLLVCTLNLNQSDPGAKYLYHRLLRYLDSDEFMPQFKVTSKKLSGLLQSSYELDVDFSTDEGYDDGGHVHPQD